MITIDAHGASIPALGFGTWELRDEKAEEQVATALRIGYRHIDTAQMYGNEREVGAGVRASGVAREEVFVTTKIWPEQFRADDLVKAAETSAEALGGAPDLLLLHWPNAAVPLAETIGALNKAREAGLTKHIGVSNFNIALLEEAIRLSEAPILCNQVEYHPFLAQDRLLAACRKHKVALTAYCPLARGKIVDEPVIVRIAEAHGKTPGQVTLRWLVQQEGVIAIPRTSSAKRAQENFEIFDFELTEEEMEAIGALRARRMRLTAAMSYAPEWDD